MKRQSTADIAVVGGGVVGLAVALGLAGSGANIVLLGAPREVREDGRTAALMQPSVDFLAGFGIRERLEGRGFPLAAIRLIDITGGLLRAPTVTFRASEIGLTHFAENFANADLVRALMAALKDTDVAIDHAAVAAAHFDDDGVALVLDDARTIGAKLVIAADGATSPLREAAGIPARRWDYEQIALTFHVTHTRDHEDVSTEFHTRAGPLTFVPYGDYRSSVVWLVTPEEATELRALPPKDLAVACQRRSSSILGDLTVAGPAGAVPMRGLIASAATGQRVMLAGEALHVFPPVGAQGLNLGLRDAAGIIGAVTGALDSGEDPGAPGILSAYERGRRLDATSRTLGVDLMNRSLIAGVMPLNLLRVAGLNAAANIPPLRRMLMRAGMGQNPLGSRV